MWQIVLVDHANFYHFASFICSSSPVCSPKYITDVKSGKHFGFSNCTAIYY